MSLVTYFICIAVFVLAINANVLDTTGRAACLNEHNGYRTQLAIGNVSSATGKFPTAQNMNQLVCKMGKNVIKLF